MKKYSLNLSQIVSSSTKIAVYELCKNKESLFESFYEETEKDEKLFGKLSAAVRIIEDTANLQTRPKTKFRPILNTGLNCKLYEAKVNPIRVYLFHEEHTGRIIVIGSMKDTQKKDIKKVVKIIKEYQGEK